MPFRLPQSQVRHLPLGMAEAAQHWQNSTRERPCLLVDLPPRASVFFGNLRDLLSPPRLPDLHLDSPPAAFWPDVFIHRRLPWFSFLESGAYHVIALAILIGVLHFLALHPAPVARSVFDHSQVIYYKASEYLPPLDTRNAAGAEPAPADSVYAPQPIISVPPEADNRSQTIVTPPNIKLKQDVALPNMVAWSDKEEKPQLEIPPAPLTPAAEISRMGPRVKTSVVTPPPDLQVSRSAPAFSAPQPAVVAPPPSVDITQLRNVGDMNIARSAVIAPAPQLPVDDQRTFAAGYGSRTTSAPAIVPPPPTLAGPGTGAGQSLGSRGRIIALSLHPAVGAPTSPPAGNRRGSLSAAPNGHEGGSGSPGLSSGTTTGSGLGGGRDNGTGSGGKGMSELPAGLYVEKAGGNTSPVAGNATKELASSKPNAEPSVPAARGSTSAKPAIPDTAAKLSEAERFVFGDRKFYSLTLNMPNLNSAGGSWIIRFAEMKQDENSPNTELSQPFVTRKVDPGYPSQLMRQNVSGTVILYAVIRADGTVGNVRVLRGIDDRLDRYATQAVSQWKFEPAMKNGAPVDVEATFKIPFRPPRSNF
jgi:TonB family protein